MKKALFLEVSNTSIIPCIMANYNIAQECGGDSYFFKSLREVAIFLYSELKNNNKWDYDHFYIDHRIALLLLIELYQFHWYDANEVLYLKPLIDIIMEKKNEDILEILEVLGNFEEYKNDRHYIYNAIKQINITLDLFPNIKND